MKDRARQSTASELCAKQCFEFWYPANDRLDVPVEFVPDRLLVQDISERRLIGIDEFLQRPMLRYGCTLVTGVDVESNQVRTIFLEAVAPRDLPKLRFVLLSQADDDDPEPYSEFYEQTADDRRSMLQFAHECTIPWGLELAVQIIL